MEHGRAVGEHAPVGGQQQVAQTVVGKGDVGDVGVEVVVSGITQVFGVAENEHGSIGESDQVSLARRGGDDGNRCRSGTSGVAEMRGVSDSGDRAILRQNPTRNVGSCGLSIGAFRRSEREQRRGHDNRNERG
ncbi:MAG: hypothetical protein GY708_15495 [Actinomycetia bacterium]|nr:hypothetical protein [Actinomycetes bacterium]